MEECIRKFDELSRYAPHMVATNDLKVQHFKCIINPDIRKDLEVADLEGTPFSKVANKAIKIERARIIKARGKEIEAKKQLSRMVLLPNPPLPNLYGCQG